MDPLRQLQNAIQIIQIPFSLVKEDQKLHVQLECDLRYIKNELQLIKEDMKNYKEDELLVQELAYDIEDFAESLWIPGRVKGPILSAIAVNPGETNLLRIKHFRERIDSLKQRQKASPKSGSRQSRDRGGATSPAEGSPSYTREDNLVGIANPKMKLLELLEPADGQDAGQQLKVISILGCPGVGKTALARVVYDHYASPVSRDFDCVAWVEASGCSSKAALLGKIHEKVKDDLETRASSAQKIVDLGRKVNKKVKSMSDDDPAGALRGILADKRYIVLIDDVQRAEVRQDTVKVFPNNENSSRIIVTTRVRSVASAWSSGSYVYRMHCLGKDDSKGLFWRRVYGCEREPAPALARGSERIFSKCDGLPLALISVAKHLSIDKGDLRRSDCEEVGKALGTDYLAGKKATSAFGDMRRALVHCYDSLPDYSHKTCLLSLSIFPRGHQINSKRLIRRLIAEGLVAAGDKIEEEKAARDHLRELIDRCIVEPVVDISSSSRVVKRCKVHSIMLEFTIEESVTKNFITLIHEHEPIRIVNNKEARVRRLSIQSSAKGKYSEVEDKSAIRSLTMFNSELFDFKSCKVLRILDLEGCTGLNKRFVYGICQLRLLKYLSLRKTDVNILPTQIEELQCLETLDVRETRVEMLPVEAIMLPKLAYLFGKFELPAVRPRKTERLDIFLSEKSELNTLAGLVVTKETQGFVQIILCARKLKKVKIWCKDTPADVPSSISEPNPTRSATPRTGPKKRLFSCFRFQENLKRSSGSNHPALGAPRQLTNLMPALGSAPGSPDPEATSVSAPSGTLARPNVPQQIEYIDLVISLTKRFTDLESLSIESSVLCKQFLAHLRCPCTISSIKLRGALDSLPKCITLSGLCDLTKLQLFSTGLKCEDLSSLQELSCLEYLKLVEHRDGFWDGNFVVKSCGFASLLQLCLEAPKLPKLRFEQGAMKNLTSLHLLCSDISQVQPATEFFILQLADLNTVILHRSATEATIQAWKIAANGHPNKPHVKKQP